LLNSDFMSSDALILFSFFVFENRLIKMAHTTPKKTDPNTTKKSNANAKLLKQNDFQQI
jgi:hypothetical protein